MVKMGEKDRLKKEELVIINYDNEHGKKKGRRDIENGN